MASHYSLLERILFPSTNINIKKLNHKLQNKTVLITGASYGIGEALAYTLAQTSVHLILVARTQEKLLLIQEKIIKSGGSAEIYALDLRNHEEMEGFIRFLKAKAKEKGIDVLVNNAGKSIKRSIFESLDRNHDFTRLMAINYHAPVQLTLALIPDLLKNKGQIINISAANVLLAAAPYWAAYHASKTAFDAWMRCVAPELHSKGVATSIIYLPLVKTRMIEPNQAYRALPSMQPEHVAHIICRAMFTRKLTYKPWWLAMGEFASFILRTWWEIWIRKRLKKKTHV